MSLRPRRAALSAFLFGSLFLAVAFALTARGSVAQETAPESIELCMRQMNGVLKALGRGISAENRDSALQQLTKFEAAVIAAKDQSPSTALAVAEKDRPAFVAEYRKSLLEVLKVVCDAEIAVLDGKYDVAQELLRTKLAALKKTGHDKFQGE